MAGSAMVTERLHVDPMRLLLIGSHVGMAGHAVQVAIDDSLVRLFEVQVAGTLHAN